MAQNDRRASNCYPEREGNEGPHDKTGRKKKSLQGTGREAKEKSSAAGSYYGEPDMMKITKLSQKAKGPRSIPPIHFGLLLADRKKK